MSGQEGLRTRLGDQERNSAKTHRKTLLIQRQIEQARADLAKAMQKRDNALAQCDILRQEVDIEAAATLATKEVVQSAQHAVHMKEVRWELSN